MMKKTDEMLRQIESDLGLNEPYFKGRNLQIKNCWHFYTDGNAVDRMFEDVEDFKAGMNRIFVLDRKYNIVILAFILMDTHVHFILYGPYEECNRFMHMYISMTSRYMSLKYGEKNKFAKLPLSHQAIDNELYLKTAICYVIKNSSTAGLPYLATDYPWSSSPLYFRNIKDNWTAPKWSLSHNLSWLSQIPFKQLRKFLRSRETDYTEAAVVDGIVFPGEYVDFETVERLFKTHKSFSFFLNTVKEETIEGKHGFSSHLSIPIQEMRQHRNSMCRNMFKVETIRSLSAQQRLRLAKALRRKYNSSAKQIAKLCGLVYDEVKDVL